MLTSSLGPWSAYHSGYKELLYKRHPQKYLIKVKKEKSPIIKNLFIQNSSILEATNTRVINGLRTLD
jgi:hypothetical protein